MRHSTRTAASATRARHLPGSLSALAVLTMCGGAAFGQLDGLKAALTYYQPCESLKASDEGESVHPNPVLEPGKIGKAFRMEQRWSLNLLKDPDFKGDVKEAWLTVGTPEMRKTGGFADPGCAAVDATNYLRQAVTDVKEGTLSCLTVYARSDEGGALVISVVSGGAEESFRSPALGKEYARFKVTCVTGAAVATVTIKGADEKKVIVDAAQFESSRRSFPRAFNPRTKQASGTEWVDVPAKVIDPMKGSVAFWTKPDWIGEVNAGSCFFAFHQDAETANKDQTSALSVGAHSDAKFKDWRNSINVSFKSRTKQNAGYSVELDKRFTPGAWFHVVVTWEIVAGGESRSVFYLNGKKVAEKRFVLDVIDAPKTAFMGYSGGGYADGLMDEFCIFNRPLTDAEAATLFSLTEALR